LPGIAEFLAEGSDKLIVAELPDGHVMLTMVNTITHERHSISSGAPRHTTPATGPEYRFRPFADIRPGALPVFHYLRLMQAILNLAKRQFGHCNVACEKLVIGCNGIFGAAESV
jgi:hypothetical protein